MSKTTTTTPKFFEVGGCVRDAIIGVESDDVDYAVEASSFETMRDAIVNRGGTIFIEKPEYLTIKAKVDGIGVADFVMCRKDGEYVDGRRPDSVTAGNLIDDLSRRDFTMNAIARDEDGTIIDPFGGISSIETGIIRCVGKARARMSEDALRLLRAVRFAITKRMGLATDIRMCLEDREMVNLMKTTVSVERVREELAKAFRFDTIETLRMLNRFPLIRDAVFGDTGIRIEPTMKK